MKTQVLLSSFFLEIDFETLYTGSYSTLCRIVDKGKLVNITTYSSDGSYYTINYDIILCFGLTELTAQYAWKENVSEGYVSLEIESNKRFAPTRVSRNGLTFISDRLHGS